MKDFFKAALSSLVTMEDDKPTPAPTVGAPAVVVMPSSIIPSFSNAEIEKFTQHFDDVLQKGKTTAAPAYYEFNKVLMTLAAHLADPKARISAAFAALSVQGLTKEKLIESANHCVELLQEDKNGLEKAITSKLEGEVGSRKTQIDSLQKEVELASQQIQDLTKKITENQAKMKTLTDESADAQSKIQRSHDSYVTAFTAVMNHIWAQPTNYWLC